MAKKNKYERKVVPSRADEREARTGMRQSKGAMIAKIVLGGLFLAVSLEPSDGEWTIGYFLFCLILGGGLIAWGAAVLYSVTDEIHQMFVPGRSCELRDVAIDSCGVATGILLCTIIKKWKKGRPH